MSARYRVTILYVEPTFARHAGLPAVTRRWCADVEAPDPDSAVDHATADFRDLALQSGVGWIRQIVGWDIVLADATDA